MSIILFDVDGTITRNGQPCDRTTIEYLIKLSMVHDIGIISSSNIERIIKQIGEDMSFFTFVFTENGTSVIKNGTILHKMNPVNLHFIDDTVHKTLLEYGFNNYYIEYRNSLAAIFPAGKVCDRTYDIDGIIRKKIIETLKSRLHGVDFTMGGQTSFEILPFGTDKTFCLQFLKEYDTIYFFGDRTSPGGNDWHLYTKLGENAYTVTSVEHTLQLCESLFYEEKK
jgi:phosphomannomutase